MQEILEVPMEREAVPVQGTSIWSDTEPLYVHKNFTAGNNMGQTARNDNKFKKDVATSAERQNSRSQERSRKTNQEWKNRAKKFSKFYWQSTGNVGGTSSGAFNAEKTFRTKEPSSGCIDSMDQHSNYNKSCDAKSDMVERPVDQMERSIIYPTDPTAGSFYRFQRLSLGSKVTCHINVKELKAVLYALKIPEVLGKSGNYLNQAFRDCRRDMESLSEYKHPPTSGIRSNLSKPGGYPLKINGSNRMGNINCNVRKFKQKVWSTRRGLICNKQKRKSKSVLQLVQRSTSTRDKCPIIQMGNMEEQLLLPPWNLIPQINGSNRMGNINCNVRKFKQKVWSTRRGLIRNKQKRKSKSVLQLVQKSESTRNKCPIIQMGNMEEQLLLPPMEPNFTSITEGSERENNNDADYSNVKFSNIFIHRQSTSNRKTSNDTGNRNITGSKKREIPATEQQELGAGGLENQWNHLQTESFQKPL
ncbi:hypothetical protein BB561_006335 [Smittium simulii]|uniref:Uncharacterized protein n=1 Tax=Smittium simulii TaxID=133385 RepID=A0A2T9Y514_9FUNG|nr:hypothetical protein BB561_006335 [Smittium simulii]